MAKPAGKAKVKPAAAKAIAASGNSKSNAGPKKGGADNKAPKPKQAGAKSSLSDEIKLLGGDDADLELINGVDDGDDEVVELEVAAEKPKAKAKAKAAKDDELQSQLKAFMKELGIDKHRDEDDDEEDEDEAEDEDEGAQDADEGDDEPEEPDDDNSAEDQLEADDADEAEDVEEAEEDDDGETALDAAGQAQLGRLKKAVSAALDSAPAAAAPKSNLLVPAIPLWHTIPLAPVEPLDEKKNPMGASEKQKRTAALLAKAQKLWDADVARYSAKGRMSTSDRDFISHVLKSGTATDKISALQLLVQESPVHNFAKLNNELTTMCDKKSRREAIQAIDAVSDLCLGGLLPDRKLRYFADRPIFSPGVTDAHLILWAFEDSLKNWYFRFIRILEVLSHDPLPYPKRRAMHRICELLSGKPEQEQNLLLLLVNKFGDSDRQAPSLASHLLLGLLKQHPAMKLVVIAEVERFIYRPGTSDRAKYYAVTFLDQIVLSHREPDVKAANKLVEIYFELFGQLLKRPEEEKDKPVEAPKKKKARHRDRGKPKPPPPKPAAESEQGFGAKMVAAVLTGVNRAWPYSKLDDSVFDAHVDILFKVSHSAALNTAIQALAFIAQVASSRSSVSDRLARAVYEMLLHPALFGSAHLAPFFNMVYKLVKLDPSVPRTVAMLKRLLAVSAGQTPMFAAAALYLFGEVAREKPGVLGAVKMGERKEDEDEEKFVDVRGDSEDEEEKEASDGDEEDNKVAEKESKAVDNAKNQGYDPYKRDPLYAKAEVTCFWELNELATHYHPTVSLYAQTLLAAQPLPIPEGGYDPLRNHSLMHFLDRFVFKNPRKAGEKEGSAMKPKDEMVGTDKDAGVLFHGGKKRMTVNGGKGDVAVNDAEWLRRARQKGVAEDEVGLLFLVRKSPALRRCAPLS